MTTPGGRGGGSGAGGEMWHRAVSVVSFQSIPIGGSWTQQIDLGVEGLNFGEAVLYIPDGTLSNPPINRMGGIIYFTDDIDDGFSLLGTYNYYEVTEYPSLVPTEVYSRLQHGYRYDTDAKLTSNYYEANGAEDLYLESAVISGQYLELVWTGNFGSELTITAEARATKVV